MGDGTDAGRVALTVVADRYAVAKAEIAQVLRARREAGRIGASLGVSPDRGEVRRLAAARVGAGVSHTVLENVLWLKRVGYDPERDPRVRLAARQAYGTVDSGDPVSVLCDRVKTVMLVAELEEVVARDGQATVTGVAAGRQLGLLASLGPGGVGSAMRREARLALAAARQADQRINDHSRRKTAGSAGRHYDGLVGHERRRAVGRRDGPGLGLAGGADP